MIDASSQVFSSRCQSHHHTIRHAPRGVASLRPTLGKEEFEPRRLRLHPLYHVLDLDAKVIIGSKVIRATHKPVAVASRASATPPVVAWGCPSPGRGDEAKALIMPVMVPRMPSRGHA